MDGWVKIVESIDVCIEKKERKNDFSRNEEKRKGFLL